MAESDGHMLIPGWGFGLGGRLGQLNLDASLANVMAPNKRPRNTNNPILIMKDGKPFIGYRRRVATSKCKRCFKSF